MAKQEKQKQVKEPEWLWELAWIRPLQKFKYGCPWDATHGDEEKDWKEFDTIDGLLDHLKTVHSVSLKDDVRKAIEDLAKAGVRALKNVHYSIQRYEDDGPTRGVLVTEMIKRQ
jgi:hypothetical protein